MPTSELPPLTAALPDFVSLPRGKGVSVALAARLRRLAKRLQRPHARPFYSIRDVASHCGVPRMTVARVYARLEEAGVLVRRRSAGTWLRGRAAHPRAPIHGVVSVPVFTYAFTAFIDLRLFLRHFEEALWEHRFALDPVFFNVYEDTRPAFADRLLHRQPDVVLAMSPIPESVPQLRSVADQGVRVRVLSASFQRLPWPQSLLSWDRALSQGLAAWRRTGITDVSVLYKPDQAAQSWAALAPLLKRTRLRGTYVDIDSEHEAARRVRALPRDARRGYLVHEPYAASNLCGMAALEMAQLMRQTRFMSTSYVNLNPRFLADTPVDLALMDWRRVATVLAEDLAAGDRRTPLTPRVFHADWRPRVPAGDFAQEF